MTFRSKVLREYAKDAPRCFLCGRTNAGDVVGAHIPYGAEFKGIGHKPPDVLAYVCAHCHDGIDGRAPGKSKSDRLADFHLAQFRSMNWLLESGRIEVNGGHRI